VSARLTSTIRVRPCNAGFAYAQIVCDGWSVSGIAVHLDAERRVEWPQREGERGAKWPIVSPPPALRDQLEAEIIEAAEAAIARSGRR
jgi:hypothetical protein